MSPSASKSVFSPEHIHTEHTCDDEQPRTVLVDVLKETWYCWNKEKNEGRFLDEDPKKKKKSNKQDLRELDVFIHRFI